MMTGTQRLWGCGGLRNVLAACCLMAACMTPATPARADSTGTSVSKFASGAGTYLYLLAGVGLPFLEDGKQGQNHALRVVDSVGTSILLARGIQAIIPEERPDHADRQSFPSEHATAVFAVATVESALHPKQAIAWYTGATLIAASRVTLHKHFIHDVLGGAILGYATARLELSRPRGLILFPVIRPEGKLGIGFARTF